MPKAKKLKTRDQVTLSLIASGLDINPGAKTPDMLPTGSDEPKLYIIGEAPGENEDLEGQQFIGKSGELLRSQIPSWIAKDVRWNNVVRTRPVTETGANRTPTQEEIDFYVPSLLKDIEATKPAVVMVAGGVPLSAILPNVGNITLSRGRKFPLKIGTHTTWVCPVLHPSYILRVQDFRGGDIPGAEQKRSWCQDIKAAIELSESGIPPVALDVELFKKDVYAINSLEDAEDANGDYTPGLRSAFEYLKGSEAVAFDFETRGFKPYEDKAALISAAFSDGEVTFSFPIGSKESRWSNSEELEVMALMRDFFFNSPNVLKVAHNLNFELEWLVYAYGEEIAWANKWADTEAESFILDERVGGHDLGYCTSLHLGFDVKSLSTVNVKKIYDEDLDSVLRYNALDAKATILLHEKQLEVITLEGMLPALEIQIARIPSLVLASCKGLLVDKYKVKEFSDKLGKQIEEIKARIQGLPEVAEYKTRFGQDYSPTSVQRTVKLLRDVIGVEAEEGTKFSTDKNALKALDKIPAAAMILELREVTKLKGTYVDSMVEGDLVYKDGRLHPTFTTTKTVTGRTSSKGPNCQNFPARKNKDIRSIVIPGKNCLFVAADFAAIEARCIAMASNDAYLMKAIKEGLDIHADWANRIIKKTPKVFESRKCDFKAFRSQIKNELVFPLFYGSQPFALAQRLGIDEKVAKEIFDSFWRMFPGVLRWQKEMMQSYRSNGYVETLTGRRRRAPMSSNMVYNSCIQGSSSDMVLDAMNRLSIKAFQENRPWLQPVMNIHDDLTFCVPSVELEGAVEEIVKEMTTFSFPWITLPIEIEVSVGPDWGTMKAIGKF